MGAFRVVCCKCGSENVLEKISNQISDIAGGKGKFQEGIRRKCTECDNESFEVFRTWQQKE